jgi:hypothetical protein
MISANSHPWPDAVDLVATIIFLAVVILVPALGYAFMAADFRAYLKSLKRGLVRAGHYFTGIPQWARYETPAALASFGLRLPCTPEDLKRAYRKRVKPLHPDHGGDQRRFLIAQAQFEQAMDIVLTQGSTEATATMPPVV